MDDRNVDERRQRQMLWVPAVTASRMLRISRQRVYQLMEAGRLAGFHMDGHVFVLTSSIRQRIDEQGG